MKEYVIVYAPYLDLNASVKIPMVYKNKPEYLKGVLNFPGGKIEEGESVIKAALRELDEEVGSLSNRKYTEDDDYKRIGRGQYFGKIIGDESIIHCVKVPINTDVVKQAEGETEKVEFFDEKELYDNPILMPNLRLILPLCYQGVYNWTIKDVGDWKQKEHTVLLNMGGHDLKVTVKGWGDHSV